MSAEFWREGAYTLIAAAVMLIALFYGRANASELFAVNAPASPEDMVWQVTLGGVIGIGGAWLVCRKSFRRG